MNGRCCSETADAQANHSPTRFQVWPFLLGSTKVCTQIKNKIHPESLNHPAKGIFGVSRSMLRTSSGPQPEVAQSEAALTQPSPASPASQPRRASTARSSAYDINNYNSSR